MADIISFYAAARRVRKPVDVKSGSAGPAQLLFFTGVRYERREAEAQKKSRKRKPVTAPADAAIGS